MFSSWLNVIINSLSSACDLCVCLPGLEAGEVGLVLTYAVTLIGSFQWTVRQSAEVENMVSWVTTDSYGDKQAVKKQAVMISLCLDDISGESGGVHRAEEWSTLEIPTASSFWMAQQRPAYFQSAELLLQYQWTTGPQRYQRHIPTQREGETSRLHTVISAFFRMDSDQLSCLSSICIRLVSWVGLEQGRVLWSPLCFAWQSRRGRSTSMVFWHQRSASMSCVRICPSSLR